MKSISKLTYDDLKAHPAWQATGDYAEDEDAKLAPVQFDGEGRIPDDLKEVWCMCVAVFANGSEHMATSMCRGDSSDGPLLWSVWNGREDVTLLLPPAPPAVLAKRGVDFFSTKFSMKKDDIFPLTIKVVSRFATSPEIRNVKLGELGVIMSMEKGSPL